MDLCKFTFQHYRTVLEMGLENGYRFIDFSKLDDTSLVGQKLCILRHDIDFMPGWSVTFGEIESLLGIKSTYFFQVGSMTYNLRLTENLRVVQRLADMGHTVGVHVDLGPILGEYSLDEITILCEEDKKVFKGITGMEPCDIVAFHAPHRFSEVLGLSIPGIRHTYEKDFFTSIKYLSDSQGWYEGCVCKIFESGKYDRIQLLTHPYVWPSGASGDFIGNMAYMIKLSLDELTEYLLRLNPLCRKFEKELRDQLRTGDHRGDGEEETKPDWAEIYLEEEVKK